jgi:anti-sigma B factor antagonist
MCASILTIDRRDEEAAVTLTIKGEIDLASAGQLESAVKAAEQTRPRAIVLDLAALEFIDSAGLHSLSTARRRAQRAGHELRLAHIPPVIERLIGIAGLDRVLLS